MNLKSLAAQIGRARACCSAVGSMVFGLGLLLALGACVPAPPVQLAPPNEAALAEALISSSLQPGDAIRLDVFREPEISREYQVDERGVVVFPLIGERNVTGYAPDSLRTTLVEAYGKYLREPSIQVTLLRRINILGEVRSPGLYPVDATMSLADVLALAGGVAPNGNPKDIRLIRDGRTLRQDLDQATLMGTSPIRSGDQIVVGQRSWASRNTGAIVSIIATVVTAVVIAAN